MTTTFWRAAIPPDMLLLISAVVLGGVVSGLLAATPLLFITTPVVAAGMAIAAGLGARVPEWKRTASEVLGRLPDGEARALLDDLIRRLGAGPVPAQIQPLTAAICEAVDQLSALEIHLAAFDAQRATITGERSARWHDALQRCQRGAALLSQRLLDASAAISRWQASQGSGENLAAVARELHDESRYQREAAHEVEALLT